MEKHEEAGIRGIAMFLLFCGAIAALSYGVMYGQTSTYLPGVSVPYATRTNIGAWIVAGSILAGSVIQFFLLNKFAEVLERLVNIQSTQAQSQRSDPPTP